MGPGVDAPPAATVENSPDSLAASGLFADSSLEADFAEFPVEGEDRKLNADLVSELTGGADAGALVEVFMKEKPVDGGAAALCGDGAAVVAGDAAAGERKANAEAEASEEGGGEVMKPNALVAAGA